MLIMANNHLLKIAICSALLMTNAHANIKSEMDLFWEQTKNYSVSLRDPVVNASSTSTTISFGGMRSRMPVRQFQLFQITPPSIKAGCNGIDINLGAFSAISASELKDMLAKTMQGVPYYAFSVGMNAMCPTCNQVMQQLADKANEFARAAKDSCYATKMLVDSSTASRHISKFGEKIRNNITETLRVDGSVDDAAEISNSVSPPEKKATAKTLLEQQINITYYALTQSKVAETLNSISDSSIQETREILMSLVGTVWSRFDSLDYNADPNSSVENASITTGGFSATITPEHFITGVSSDSPVNLIICDESFGAANPSNNKNACINPKIKMVTSAGIPSMKKMIFDILKSQETKMGLRGEASKLTAEEMAFNSIDPLASKEFMNELKANGAYRNWNIPETFSQDIARSLAYDFTIELLKKVETALNQAKNIPEGHKDRVKRDVLSQIKTYTMIKEDINAQLEARRAIIQQAAYIYRRTPQ